jgi:hypothetical protein
MNSFCESWLNERGTSSHFALNNKVESYKQTLKAALAGRCLDLLREMVRVKKIISFSVD